MHSFHQSRGRILFEVLCALAISASLVGTWMQTGASALLPAAAAALLYGLVHMFDMFRRRPGGADQRPTETAADQGANVTSGSPASMAAEQLVAEVPVPVFAELIEPAAPPARKSRQPKTPRKKAKIAETAPVEWAKVVEMVPDEDPEVVELVTNGEPVDVVPMPLDEESHASVTPLFEPEPFVRQQRAVFGRKSG